MTQEVAKEIRYETTRNLLRAMLPKCNLPAGELKVLRHIRVDNGIIILLAYKVNTTVVMNTLGYQQTIRELLDLMMYAMLTKDLTQSVDNN